MTKNWPRVNRLFYFLFLFVAISSSSFAQNISGVINTYTPVTAINNCVVSVVSSTGFSPGDKVLIIQMKGAEIDTSNTAAFGNILNYNNTGNYEINTIQSIAGNNITMQFLMLRNYTISGFVQLVRVPVYNNANVNGVLTCQPWNGSTGGVLVFIDNGTTSLNANIDVKNFGFRGTPAQTIGWASCNAMYKELQSTIEAAKGESITILTGGHTKGVGAPSNGGGGGRTDNGGGGASNFAAGGLGGNLGWTALCNLQAQGGKALTYNNVLNKVFLGGAGGDAQRSEGPGTNMGVNGSGMVIIKSNAISGNGNSIIATGAAAVNTIQDGGGGGGAGGSVLLEIPTYNNAINVNTSGGKGGDAVIYTSILCSGGGGAGGGVLWVSTAAVSGNITYTSTGGAGGLSKSSVNGSPGNNGGTVTQLKIPFSNVPCGCVPPTLGMTQVNVTCNGLSNGSATVSATGGISPYTYTWVSSGGTNANATGLSAAIYTVTVTEAGGCTASATVSITQPTAITANASGVNPGCGQNNGSVSVTASGGTGAFTYSWNPGGQTNSTATSLSGGTYVVTVTDANNCTKTASVSITSINSPTASISAFTNPNCFGGTGTATVSAAGGNGSYTYSWSAGAQTTQTATALANGTFTVTVTDGNGCTGTATVTITVPALLTSGISNSVNPTCSVQGSATASAAGGTGAFTYSWSAGAQTAQTATGLNAGTYTVTVTDNKGCTSTATVTITGTSGPSVTTSVVNVLCNGGNTGSASVTATGGVGTYTYLWSNTQNTQTSTGLTAGNYSVVVSDANGCTSTASVTVTEPTLLTVNSTGSTICSGQLTGTVSGTAGGGTPNYNYAWSGGQNTQTATGLSAGIYTLTVTDQNGCTATTTAQITSNPSPVVVFTADDTSGCVALCVNLTCTTANINAWTWSFGDGSSNGSGSPINHCYKTAGAFNVTLTITDNNGCTGSLTKNAYINVFPNVVAAFSASPQPTTVLSPTITFTDLSTGGANTWSWTFGDLLNSTSNVQNPVFTYKDSGCYNVRLIADNQYVCPDTADQVVCILGDFELFAPNAFTPDGSGLNDVWNVKGIGIDPNNFKLWIFDRWGNLIFETDDLFKGWNGKANGGREIAQQDVYVWKVATKDFLGGKHTYIGHINLVR